MGSRVVVGAHGGRAVKRSPRALRRLAIVTVPVTYALVVLGDTVRVTQSGMGCRSWPLCNGHIGLVGDYHAMLEQSHRYLAAAVTVLVVLTYLAAWRQARHVRSVRLATLASVVTIAVQVPLGAITVLAHNAGWTVAMHLAGAWLVVAAVTVTMVAVTRSTRSSPVAASRAAARGASRTPAADGLVAQTLTTPLGVSLVAVFLVAVAGMLVLHDHATLSCPSWPLCPRWSSGAALQYLHRSMALVAGVAVAWLAVRVWRLGRTTALERSLTAATLGLLLATAAFGAVVATTGAPEYAQDVHLALASGLWLTLVALASCILLPGAQGLAVGSPTRTGPRSVIGEHDAPSELGVLAEAREGPQCL